MATIASLLVNLGMNTAGFDKGARKAGSSLRSLAEGAVALNSVIGVAREAGNQMSNLFGQFTSSSQNIDDLGKLSDRLGFATEDLVALQHAAGLAGVENETLNNALQKMNVNLAKAMQGGEVAKVFESMGLDAQKLIDINPMDALGQIADGLAGFQTPAEKAAAAVAIFGKSGAGLLTVLQDGSQGLRDARKEAEAFGITFDRLSALQVEQANDAMTRAGTVLTGLKNSLVIALSPAVEAAAVTWKNFVNEIKQGNVLFGYTDAVRAATAEFNNLNPTAKKTVDIQSELAAASERAAAAQKKQAEATRLQKNALLELHGRFEGRNSLIEAFDSPLEALKRREFALDDALGTLENDNASGRVVGDAYELQRAGLMQAMERLQKQKDEAAKEEFDNSLLGKMRAAAQSPQAKHAARLAEIEEAFGSGVPGFLVNPLEDEKSLATLMAQKELLEATDGPGASGGVRAGALERGTAAAFSASFSSQQDSVSKNLAEIKRIDKEMLEVSRRIEAKGTVKAAKF